MTDNEKRPSPDLLLKEAKNEQVGKLKIFLGAAPGVGKTYAMLNAARGRLNDGADVVVGVVETHQRSETQALADGLDAVPKQKLDYRGLPFEEMDLDAILKRRPKLVLVDELAHTNIPGARHTKRYQDVQEILEAGIDVFTTLNVQHIESLNDIVARITGVKVRETVPDNIVQNANAIELIDLPPDELLQRLKEGKVYIPEQARLAINRFFTPGNLTALRELALRQAAERVDEQMANLMRRYAIAGPWPTSNRVMVCIVDDHQGALLVRTARRSAERRQASWIVLHVETSRHRHMSEKAREEITQAMALGESMGAETMTVTGEDVPTEILRVARERNVSTIIVGKSRRSLWSKLTRPSVATGLIKKGDGFDILLVNNADNGIRNPASQRLWDDSEKQEKTFDIRAVLKTGFILGLASVLAVTLSPVVPLFLLSSIFLLAVLLVALDIDFLLGLAATAFSAGMLALLGSPSELSLSGLGENGVETLLFVLVFGGIVSFVADHVHRQFKITRHHAERTQSLYDFTKSIAAAATIDDVTQVTVRRVAITLGAHVAVLLPKNERLDIAAAIPADLTLDTASSAAMDWVWRHKKPAGFRSDTLPGTPFYGLPLQAGPNTLGVLAIRIKDGKALTPAQNNFLLSLTYQAASAIERATLVSDVTQARLQTEVERLRTSLLSSVSHDMRIPLDNIILTSRNLTSDWKNIPPDQQYVLVSHIGQESDRLDRFIENFLDMTELVTGNMRYVRTPTNLRSIIELALARLSRCLKGRQVIFDCPDKLPLIPADANALRRVFVNLIENACSYSMPDQPISILLRVESDGLTVAVNDRGIGIPENQRLRVFDMFYRIKKNTAVMGAIAGAGLGLSICRGFVEAHGGTISAQPGVDGVGTTILVTLPIEIASS
ncbi:MAG: sensor histidine kinase KdpD [Alphaproteobacteria bacterium]|nr:sensor histidine kinase KdpD [Alphaproteobacteria bacterium]